MRYVMIFDMSCKNTVKNITETFNNSTHRITFMDSKYQMKHNANNVLKNMHINVSHKNYQDGL